MSKQVQIRRDTTANLASMTPALGEIGVDTTRKALVVGDGVTAGGIQIPNMTEAAALGGGGLQNVEIYTSDDTWTKPAGLNFIRVTVIGGGGGGAGRASSADAAGGGGAAGGMSQKIILAAALGATEVVTVGVKGIGVSATNGTAGTSSSLGAHCSATGGGPGLANRIGGTGGLGSGGGINAQGGHGGDADVDGNSGEGGSSFLGAGGKMASPSVDGSDAVTPGSGGGGGATNSAGNVIGGDGANGIVIVEEVF